MQIGPRIRIGGSLGKFGDKAKKVVGKAARNPFVQGGLGLLTGGATLPFLVGAGGGLLKEHASVGDVLKGGAQGFAAGSAGKGIRSIGTKLLSAGGSTVPSSTGTIAGEGPWFGTDGAAEIADGLKPIAPGAGAPASVLGQGTKIGGKVAAPSLLGRATSALGSVGSAALKHPNATAGVLQGVGNMVGSGAENRLNNAQANALEQRTNESAYDFEQRKRREAELAPIWSALGSSVGGRPIAANPYLPRAG